jgi:tRNA(Met) C34 N-acetyltransferase TmcA
MLDFMWKMLPLVFIGDSYGVEGSLLNFWEFLPI